MPSPSASAEARLVDRPACPLCGSREAVVHIPFRSIPVKRCAGCGFLYSSRIFDAQGFDDYTGTYGNERNRRGQMVNARVNLAALSSLVDLRAHKTAVDVGCGYGFLLRSLAVKHGLDVKGLDLSREETEYAKGELGLDVRLRPASDSGLPPGSFDLVMSFEVIEHVDRPIPFVETLAALAKPGGTIVIKTDNFESSICRAMGPGFPKWIPHCHISHFGPESLRRCIAAVPGLELVTMRSFTPWELHASRLRSLLRSKPDPESFDLDAEVRGDREATYRMFRVRRLLNAAWYRLTNGERMDGALMFAVARKKSG